MTEEHLVRIRRSTGFQPVDGEAAGLAEKVAWASSPWTDRQ
jgi:hypothetical protein